MTGIGVGLVVIGLGMTGTSLLVVWKGASAGGLFGAEAAVSRYIWRIGVVVIAVGVLLAIIGALVGW